MAQTVNRGVPVRDDRWRPTDVVLNGIIRKCIEDSHRRGAESGSTTTVAAGGLVLGVFGVIISVGTGNPVLGLLVAVGLAALGLVYAGVKAPPPRIDRRRILDVLGGPGNLPAGYLVYGPAWQAGMPEYLHGVTDRELRIAVKLCRYYPCAVSDLIRLVARAERHAMEHAVHGHEVTDNEIFKIANRMTAAGVASMANAPTMVIPAAA
ncbi:hypothetical protein [Actinoplanes sp. NPDC051851]|uniref:hypothetical protein n=1 Tax=Actinoplanes sp. NPDC051851 TaxID=3154753 RepID=UPI00343D94A0